MHLESNRFTWRLSLFFSQTFLPRRTTKTKKVTNDLKKKLPTSKLFSLCYSKSNIPTLRWKKVKNFKLSENKVKKLE